MCSIVIMIKHCIRKTILSGNGPIILLAYKYDVDEFLQNDIIKCL